MVEAGAHLLADCSFSFIVQGGEREVRRFARAPAQGRATADNPTKAAVWARPPVLGNLRSL